LCMACTATCAAAIGVLHMLTSIANVRIISSKCPFPVNSRLQLHVGAHTRMHKCMRIIHWQCGEVLSGPIATDQM
jgi:hypothetical protein